MVLGETLQKIIAIQQEEIIGVENTIPRDISNTIDTKSNHAVIISGIRRSGKSTLLKQFMLNSVKYHYFNFEDTRIFGFDMTDFEKLIDLFEEDNPDINNYYFDEIQNVPQWEIYVRTLLNKKSKVYITGSNASLLSKELGTKLTGRHIRYELFPFSYREFLEFTRTKPGETSFQAYLNNGGFPEFLEYQNIKISQELLNDIIARDIVVRYGLRNPVIIKNLALYLISNVAKEISYTNLKKMFNLGSVNSIISYINYFEDCYLLFQIPKFDYSIKKQLVNPKKIYAIDTGFIKCNSLSFSENIGRMLENALFISLKRSSKEIYYFQENHECDFVIKSGNDISHAYQACYHLHADNKEREINGLLEAMNSFNLNTGYIITYNQKDKITFENKTIHVIPAWRWMLNEN